MPTLVEAIQDLYRIAVAERKIQSPARLQLLAEYCREQLECRGLSGVALDKTVPGGGRDKQWDVVWYHGGLPRLVISLKSILSNLPGTVPNRLDDLMGETANAQLHSPEIVTGYVMVLNVADDPSRKWASFLRRRLEALSGRRRPHWSIGTIEGFLLVEVDFSGPPKILSEAEQESEHMFAKLVGEVRTRNPVGDEG